MQFPLTSHDLCLRPWQMSDAPAFQEAALESVATVGKWMNWCHAAYSLDDAEQWMAKAAHMLAEGTAYEMGIFSIDGQELYGGIGVNLINNLHKYANVGYWLRQSCHGKGIATDALRLALAFGLQELQMVRLEIVTEENNLASRRLAERVGAKFEGILHNRLMLDGIPRRAALYAVFPPAA